MNTQLQTKTTSSVYQTKTLYTALEIILLMALGMVAITLHAKWRYPMRIPGHHGLEFMALIAAGRAISKMKYASVFSSIGVALMIFIPFMGFRDPFMAFVFLLPGMFLDIFYNSFASLQKKVWFVALAGAFAHAMVPIARFFISLITGYQYGSLISGVFYPYTMWLFFGFAGSMIGAGIVYGVRKLKKQ